MTETAISDIVDRIKEIQQVAARFDMPLTVDQSIELLKLASAELSADRLGVLHKIQQNTEAVARHCASIGDSADLIQDRLKHLG